MQQLLGEGQAAAGAAAVSVALVSVHATLWTLQVLRAGQMTRPAQRLSSTSHAAGRQPCSAGSKATRG